MLAVRCGINAGYGLQSSYAFSPIGWHETGIENERLISSDKA